MFGACLDCVCVEVRVCGGRGAMPPPRLFVSISHPGDTVGGKLKFRMGPPG